MNFTQNKEFRNAIDVKFLALQITHDYYPEITEKLMETREEYLQGCRESNIRSLIQDETLTDLSGRIAEFGSNTQYLEAKQMLINFVVENNLIDEDELR